VYIGEKRRDVHKEAVAEIKLGDVFPLVSIVTDADGAKFIPVQEVSEFVKVLEKEKEQQHRDGYDKGYQDGHNKGLEEASRVLRQFDKAINDCITQREAILEEARQGVLEMVMQISRKVTFDAVRVDPESTVAMINGVIDHLVDRSKLKIKVAHDHLPIVEQNIDRFLKGSAIIKEITIEADPRVRAGGCLIETPSGDIDARLESQLEVVEDTILLSEDQN
jgi:flagellar biosynthesis/type III secretory pathway protein FliH